MKLTKKEAEKVVELYNLGELRGFELNPNGNVNYNFDFRTLKGDYMVRLLGHKMSKWKEERLDLEFGFLNFLNDKKFPYAVPCPLKNKNGNFVFKLNENYLWVYKKIPGEVNCKSLKIQEVAKALAILHKFAKKFKLNPKEKYYDIDWLFSKYSEIREKVSKLKKINEIDKLVVENLDLFEFALKRIIKMNYRKEIMLTHSDFGAHNLLFKENKVIGILDFDNLGVNPKVKEIAYPMQRLCFINNKLDKKKMNQFLKEYEKVIKLTKKEKDMILPMMVLDSCGVFWWAYMAMQKKPEKGIYFLKENISKLKYLLHELDWLK